jgi:hypothetical protein
MKKLFYLFLLVTPLLLCGCPENDGHRELFLVNKSGKKIGYQISFGYVSEISQDTIFQCNKTSDNLLDNDSLFIIESTRRLDWEHDLGSNVYVEILILDGAKFSKYINAPCDSVRQNVPILHAYRLTLADVEKMNWMIVYQ